MWLKAAIKEMTSWGDAIRLKISVITKPRLSVGFYISGISKAWQHYQGDRVFLVNMLVRKLIIPGLPCILAELQESRQ